MEQEILPPTGPLKINQVEAAQETYFFERSDGSVFPVQEREASEILKGRTQILGRRAYPPKLIGVSDGRLFQRAVLESHELYRQGFQEEAMARLRLGEKEELEAARGKIKMPRDFDVIDYHGNPTKLML